MRLFAFAVVAVSLAASAEERFSAISLQGWTQDGKSVVYEGDVAIPDEDGTNDRMQDHHYAFTVVADENGKTQHLFRKEQRAESDDAVPDAAKALWDKAEPEEAGGAWLKEHPLTAAPKEVTLAGKTKSAPLTLGGKQVALALQAKKGACRKADLVADGELVFTDACAAKLPEVSDVVAVAPAPGGQRGAVAWTADFHRSAGGTELHASHAYFAVLSSASLAAIDLLDAGGDAEAAAGKLESAGFRIGHRGQAAAKRPASAVYFSKGHDAQAKAVAARLGVPESAVQPLSWKSPWSITVAVAPGK